MIHCEQSHVFWQKVLREGCRCRICDDFQQEIILNHLRSTSKKTCRKLPNYPVTQSPSLQEHIASQVLAGILGVPSSCGPGWHGSIIHHHVLWPELSIAVLRAFGKCLWSFCSSETKGILGNGHGVPLLFVKVDTSHQLLLRFHDSCSIFFHVLKASELSIVQLVLKVVRTEILELHNIFQSNKAILQSWALHVATFRNMDRRGTRWLGFKLPLCCVLSVSSFGLVHLNFLFKVNVLSDSHIQLVGSVPQNIWEPHCVTS